MSRPEAGMPASLCSVGPGISEPLCHLRAGRRLPALAVDAGRAMQTPHVIIINIPFEHAIEYLFPGFDLVLKIRSAFIRCEILYCCSVVGIFSCSAISLLSPIVAHQRPTTGSMVESLARRSRMAKTNEL